MKRFGRALLVSVMAVVLAFIPVTASAGTMTVTQVITVTATVAPTRSIIVNEQGEIIKIYSNTSEPVEPKVYTGSAQGEPRRLTSELHAQYQQIVGKQKHLAGVAIPVSPPVEQRDMTEILMKSISSLIRPLSL